MDTAVISVVRDRVRALADSLGFPADLQRPSVAAFDRPAARILHDEMTIIPADAASEEVWNFLTLVVLPDVAVWRFPGRADERLLGRPRNAFRRLWWRAETIGADLIDAPRGLGEDELVNIMERPTLAANPRIARMLAQLIVERGDGVGSARSEVMRDVAKRFLRKQAVVCIDGLPDASVQAILDECLHETAVSLGTKQPLPPTSANAVPEAWLPDPTGRHDVRWWNGHSWTDQVSDAGARSNDSLHLREVGSPSPRNPG